MASTTRWLVNTAWTAVTITVGTLTTGGVNVASATTNSSILDIYADVSLIITMGGTTTATSYLSLYLLPLQQDGTTYGDGTASGTTAPVASYLVSSCFVKSGVASGSTVSAMFRGIVLPPGDFKFALVNNTGVSFNATPAITMKYRGYDENLNA